MVNRYMMMITHLSKIEAILLSAKVDTAMGSFGRISENKLCLLQ